MQSGGNFYAVARAGRKALTVDLAFFAADILLDVLALWTFASHPQCWILSLNAIGIVLNVLNMFVEGISFNIYAAASECLLRNEYAPAFLRIILSEAMYEAGVSAAVQLFALVQAEGLNWFQAFGLLLSSLLSLRSLVIGRMICGMDITSQEGPFSLRAFMLMPGYRMALLMRFSEIAFRFASMAVLVAALHPAIVATLLFDVAVVAWGYFRESGDVNDTVCFTVTGAPLLLLSWQGGAVFGRHKLDGRIWYSVTLARTAVPFAFVFALGKRAEFTERFPVGELLTSGMVFSGDPLAACRALLLVICGLSGLALCAFVVYLDCYTRKLQMRDRDAEREHRAIAERLKADFHAAQSGLLFWDGRSALAGS